MFIKHKIKLKIFILFLVLAGCNAHEKAERDNNLTNYIGKSITFPSAVKLVNYYSADSVSFNSLNPKIVYWINGDCSICIKELEVLQDIVVEIQQLVDIEPVIIAVTSEYYILDYLLEISEIKMPVYYDTNNEFYGRNTLTPDKNQHCFILTKDNIIDFVGNPAIDKSSHKNFFKYFRSINKR